MAYLELSRSKLRDNVIFLDQLFSNHQVNWGVVTKLLCGHKQYIEELIHTGLKELHDSRISNLKTIKAINPEIQTVYIKPPSSQVISSLVKFADVSFNTELQTIRLISAEAIKQKKVHKIIIMIELGDLREGVLGENLIGFYQSVFQLENIQVIGLGANLNCLNGILPSHDKLIQLSLYKQLIEATFRVKIPFVSGGSSVTVPLLMKKMLPKGINHFRLGETLFFGNNLISGKPIKGMKSQLFTLYAEIVEMMNKPLVPFGEIGTNVAGDQIEINEQDYGKSSCRALLDIGLLDVDLKNISPVKKWIKILGASSDMISLDLGENKAGLKLGDRIAFNLNYMGALKVMNSNYIDKVIVD
jgi:ornithine racemase